MLAAALALTLAASPALPVAHPPPPAAAHVKPNVLVKVIVSMGALTVVAHARTASCAREDEGRVCAVLKNGHRVVGDLDKNGDLIVGVER